MRSPWHRLPRRWSAPPLWRQRNPTNASLSRRLSGRGRSSRKFHAKWAGLPRIRAPRSGHGGCGRKSCGRLLMVSSCLRPKRSSGAQRKITLCSPTGPKPCSCTVRKSRATKPDRSAAREKAKITRGAKNAAIGKTDASLRPGTERPKYPHVETRLSAGRRPHREVRHLCRPPHRGHSGSEARCRRRTRSLDPGRRNKGARTNN